MDERFHFLGGYPNQFDEFILIRLCSEYKLDDFYQEAENALALLLKSQSVDFPPQALKDALHLNRSLVKLPFQTLDLELDLSNNIWEAYRSVLLGKAGRLEKKPSKYSINRTSDVWNSWEEWARKVIWWGNKKGAYLYGNTPPHV